MVPVDTTPPSFTMEEVLKTIGERMPKDEDKGWTVAELCEYHGHLPTQQSKDRMRIIIKDLEVTGLLECFGKRRIERPHRSAYWAPVYRLLGETDALQVRDMRKTD